MNWESRYLPPNPTIWQGQADIPDGSCFFQHVRLLDLLAHKPQKTAPITFALLGFKCEEGVERDLGRTGASEGPIAIRQQLAKLPFQNAQIHCYDAGNIVCIDHDMEQSQRALSEVVATLLSQNIRPLIIGGGHEIAFGHYLGIAKVYPPARRLGILNFDSHFDLQSLKPIHRPSATTAFYQIAE